ncbi:OmpA family protein [Flavihumibacter profundi]|uniref:OmpA family protein n=1 Tax=Flavihumibacter profundi TaxID=2716883 RepID=UPI001CC5A0CC|nr:OmpA family protein [Flavihumibacter profundi]MBZ5859225.1 OmpA family protein [Flavihumibacter profundi]
MKKIIIAVLAIAIVISGCKTMNKQQKGTVAGATGGALIGAAVSHGSIWGILIGAAIGGTAGNLIGKKMDQQAKELQQAVPTAEVQRVGEGINMTFESGLLFKLNSFELNSSYEGDLASAAGVFNKYPDTNILIEGHTDDTGKDEYNQALSEKRAHSVTAFLISKGVDPKRITEKGYGESQPKYPNDSEANRAKNRRVELGVYANDQMKKDATEGKLQ